MKASASRSIGGNGCCDCGTLLPEPGQEAAAGLRRAPDPGDEPGDQIAFLVGHVTSPVGVWQRSIWSGNQFCFKWPRLKGRPSRRHSMQRAAVHHHAQPGRPRRLGGLRVDHAELHPDRAGAEPDRVVDHRADLVGAAEHVDHVERRGVVERADYGPAVQALPGQARVDAGHVEPARGQEGEHVVAGALRLVRRADHGDAPGAREDVGDLVGHGLHNAGPARMVPAAMSKKPSFQDLILRLHAFWAAQGCVILQPYDVEMGAGTFHPATTLRALGRGLGGRPTCSRAGGRRTGATARTRTGSATTTSIRSS